jgi:serine O-acetyltransferase
MSASPHLRHRHPALAAGAAELSARRKDADQPTVDWAETRRLVRLDLEAYETWLPHSRSRWPSWRRLLSALFTTQGFAANLLYRLQIYLDGRGARALAFQLQRLNLLLFSVTIGRNVRIGGGFNIVHGQIVVDGITTLGSNITISPFVVVGLSNGSRSLLDFTGPVLGDDVYIGAGARILGPIRVGDRARIGASAVVLDDVPDDHTAVGIPARVRPNR